MYPQTVVPLTNPIHDALTEGWNDSTKTDVTQVKDTEGNAIHYTANIDANPWNPNIEDESYSQELNEVYSYKGDRYVKVTPWRFDATGTDYYYNDKVANPDNIERVTAATGDAGHLRWFKVEPIKWIILNIDGSASEVDAQGKVTEIRLFGSSSTTLELYAADVLVGGIPFNTSSVPTANRTVWEGSLVNAYLNKVFYKEAFPMTDILDSTVYNNRNLGESTISDIDDPQYNSNINHFPTGGLNETIQKIYLLSYYELSNANSPYVGTDKIFAATTGASDTRQAGGTDYARAHNIYLADNRVYYWTRTSHDSTNVYRVFSVGQVSHGSATASLNGTRPALQLK